MKNIEFKDNLLYIDNKLIPIKFDMSLFLNGILYVTELPESFIMTTTELNADGTPYIKCNSSPKLMEYSNIFKLNIDLVVPLSLGLVEDIKMVHGFNITDYIQGTLEFNLNTEEGRYAYGLVEKTIKDLRVQLRLNDIEKDFIS